MRVLEDSEKHNSEQRATSVTQLHQTWKAIAKHHYRCGDSARWHSVGGARGCTP